MTIPLDLVLNNSEGRDPGAPAWVRDLPQLIDRMQEQWSITAGRPFPDLSFNYAAPAILPGGGAAVLKLSYPDGEFMVEAEAVQAFSGRGMVELLAIDIERGAMLLERIDPGTPLFSLRDEEAEVSIAAAAMQRLWRSPPEGHHFPTVADWGQAFERHRREYRDGDPLPRSLLERGEALYRQLDASSPERVLLHGDLHHQNILAGQREPWLVIDPKGVVGDPAYEVWPLLNNLWEEQYDEPRPAGILSRRVDQLSEELGIERDRIAGWGFAGCILSAVWSAEDGGEVWEDAITHAEMLVHRT